jgi:hypothetical protein
MDSGFETNAVLTGTGSKWLGFYPTLDETSKTLSEMDLTKYRHDGASIIVTEYAKLERVNTYEFVDGQLKEMAGALM